MPNLNSIAGTLGAAVGDGDEAHEDVREDPSESLRPRLDGFLPSVASDLMVDVEAVDAFLPCLLNARTGTGCRTNFLSVDSLASASLISTLSPSQSEDDRAGELAAEEPLSDVSEPASESPLVLLASELLDNSRVIGRGCGLAPTR